jgi:hypothetical protein
MNIVILACQVLVVVLIALSIREHRRERARYDKTLQSVIEQLQRIRDDLT